MNLWATTNGICKEMKWIFWTRSWKRGDQWKQVCIYIAARLRSQCKHIWVHLLINLNIWVKQWIYTTLVEVYVHKNWKFTRRIFVCIVCCKYIWKSLGNSSVHRTLRIRWMTKSMKFCHVEGISELCQWNIKNYDMRLWDMSHLHFPGIILIENHRGNLK